VCLMPLDYFRLIGRVRARPLGPRGRARCELWADAAKRHCRATLALIHCFDWRRRCATWWAARRVRPTMAAALAMMMMMMMMIDLVGPARERRRSTCSPSFAAHAAVAVLEPTCCTRARARRGVSHTPAARRRRKELALKGSEVSRAGDSSAPARRGRSFDEPVGC
jgi:hypothetical protein